MRLDSRAWSRPPLLVRLKIRSKNDGYIHSSQGVHTGDNPACTDGSPHPSRVIGIAPTQQHLGGVHPGLRIPKVDNVEPQPAQAPRAQSRQATSPAPVQDLDDNAVATRGNIEGMTFHSVAA